MLRWLHPLAVSADVVVAVLQPIAFEDGDDAVVLLVIG